jgi:hypothetical protein
MDPLRTSSAPASALCRLLAVLAAAGGLLLLGLTTASQVAAECTASAVGAAVTAAVSTLRAHRRLPRLLLQSVFHCRLMIASDG